MKKQNRFLIILSAAALSAATFNASATSLLSPRATGNEIKTTVSTANDPNLATVDQGLAAPPRLAGNRTATVAGAANEINPATKCSQNMTASPKAIQVCAENPAMAMPCCGKPVATAN